MLPQALLLAALAADPVPSFPPAAAAPQAAAPGLTLSSASRSPDPVLLPPVSVFDAQGLGDHRLGFAFGFGFPYVQALAAFSALDALDAQLTVDTVYGAATQLGLGAKLRLVQSDTTAFALRLRGEAAWFRTPASSEDHGVRYVTGLRNYALEPELIFSTRRMSGALWVDLGVQVTFDLEPQTTGPLSGDPGDFRGGANAHLEVGGELASSALLHAYGVLGVQAHFNPGDFPLIPYLTVGFSFPG